MLYYDNNYLYHYWASVKMASLLKNIRFVLETLSFLGRRRKRVEKVSKFSNTFFILTIGTLPVFNSNMSFTPRLAVFFLFRLDS